MGTKPQEGQSIGDGSLHIGDRVVYPNQGICRIKGVETKQIAGRDWEVVTLSREEDGATVMVPREKVMGIGLRKVADVAAIDEVFDQLAAPGEGAQLDWKVRHRENADRMHGGGLFGTVEVLKGLHLLSRIRALPPKERELYDSARHLLVGEIAAAMNIPLHVAEDNLDYVLWPPPGMKRKGRVLEPVTLGPPPAGAIRAATEDDDLGFGDEDVAEEPAAVKVGAEDEAEDADEEEGEEPGEKKAGKAKAPAAAAKGAPKAPAPAAARPALVPPPPAAPAPKLAAAAARPAPPPAAAKPAPAPAPAKPAPAPTAAKAAPAPAVKAPHAPAAKAAPAKAASVPAKAKPAAAEKAKTAAPAKTKGKPAAPPKKPAAAARKEAPSAKRPAAKAKGKK
jgi:RNA polymerase-interacting CarD/CdnL/TRCF family regulator